MAIIALCLLAGIHSWFENGHGLASAIVLNLVAVAFGMLLLGAITRTEQPCRPLRSTWLRGLSTVSYSVYLLHMMLVPVAMVIARQIANNVDLSALQLFLLFAPVFAALSLATGYLLHLSVEKPFLLLKDRIRL